MINNCRTVLRRRRRQAGPDPSTGDPPGESAEALALIGEEHRQVLAAIRRLPARQREVLVLRFYLDLDEGEIAARPDVPLGPPASTYVRSGQVPPYFVTRTPSGAAVHLTVSGATVATIRPSLPGGTVVAVTAAGDDRTFVLAEQGQDRKAVTFYQFRLGSSGRPGALTPLPMSVADAKTMTGLALSPGGTELAIAVAPGRGVQQVRLYPVHGGPARTWSATGGTIGGPLAARLLSWPASQRTLAFNWSVGQTASVRLLDIGSGSGSLLAASHPAVTLATGSRR